MKSYELGVLLLPSLLPPPPAMASAAASAAAAASSAATVSTTASAAAGGPAAAAPAQEAAAAGYYAPRVGDVPLPEGAWALPIPYALPPTRYTSTDIVWSSTDGGNPPRLPRSQTAVRPDRHGRLPGEASGGHYGPLAVGRVLAEETRRKASSDAKKRKAHE